MVLVDLVSWDCVDLGGGEGGVGVSGGGGRWGWWGYWGVVIVD